MNLDTKELASHNFLVSKINTYYPAEEKKVVNQLHKEEVKKHIQKTVK